MPNAHPVKVRENCVRQFLMGIDTFWISVLENVCEKSVKEYIDRYFMNNTVLTESEIFGDLRGRPATVTHDDLLTICALWAEDPTLYVQEIADILSKSKGTVVSRQTVSYWSKQMGITRKKLLKVCPLFMFF